MPQGERRGVEINLSDKIYDGIKDDSYLHGGLGQLTDGQKGDDNFKVDTQGLGKGAPDTAAATVLFRQAPSLSPRDEIRGTRASYKEKSTLLRVLRRRRRVRLRHRTIDPRAESLRVPVFSSAKIWFSIGGRYFHNQAVQFSYPPDLFFDHSRNVTIFLHHGIEGRENRTTFCAARWLLLSEVSFDSGR
ncbi:discoidin domain-containing receptor 2, partial [Trichonephila clavipes]